MRRSVLVGIGVVGGLLIGLPGVSVAKDIADVFITNGTDAPVPTAAQGITNVAGTVDVGSVPTVNVAGTVDVGSMPTVNIVSATDREPYQHRVLLNQTEANCTPFVCTASFPAVPAGKRLVITYASARYAITAAASQQVRLGVNGDVAEPFILLPAPVSIADGYLASGPVTFYVEAGSVPTLSMIGQFVSPLSITAVASIVGHLVPAT